jgi:DNA-binding response OmpR family regulator
MEKRPTIMLIDDDADDRALFLDAMNEVDCDMKCITAEDGEVALKMLRDESVAPDFIFLDLNMPRINGKQCLAEIMRIDHLRKVPVIMYSTTRRSEDVEETKKLGAVHFLTKPILFREICAAIRNVIDTNWTSRQDLAEV